MTLQFEYWVFAFFLFTMIGWLQESVIESLYHRKLINRGFLKGPYIPIYGYGGIAMLVCCLPFRWNGFLVFLVGMAACTALEFFVGWLMEKLFNKQFWDYSMFRITYKNRISLVSSLFWGALSLFMVYVLYDIVKKLCFSVPHVFVYAFDIVMAVVVSVDFIITTRKAFREKKHAKQAQTEKCEEAAEASDCALQPKNNI